MTTHLITPKVGYDRLTIKPTYCGHVYPEIFVTALLENVSCESCIRVLADEIGMMNQPAALVYDDEHPEGVRTYLKVIITCQGGSQCLYKG